MRKILIAVLSLVSLAIAQGPRRAPGFALADTKGQWHDLYDYRGKVVLLEFMQTTCPHCAAFTDILKKVQQKYGDKIAILAVANPPDTGDAIAQFISGHQISYPIVFDMGQVAYSYVRKPHVDLPQLYVIDAKGDIVADHGYGPLTREIFEGNGLINELDRIVSPAKIPAKK
jgi:peroxiredoxin